MNRALKNVMDARKALVKLSNMDSVAFKYQDEILLIAKHLKLATKNLEGK